MYTVWLQMPIVTTLWKWNTMTLVFYIHVHVCFVYTFLETSPFFVLKILYITDAREFRTNFLILIQLRKLIRKSIL